MDTKLLNSCQYLFFILDDEKFALKTKDIQEIVDLVKITRVPNANKCIKGITNIRGELIPVLDPKIRFNKGEISIGKRTSLIIINTINSENQKRVPIAILVDVVIEVEEINEDDLLLAPVFGTVVEERYIQNIIRYKDEYISLLNIDNFLDIRELSSVE